MKWFLMLLIFVTGIYYLVNQHKRETARKEMVQMAKSKAIEEPPLPVKTEKAYVMKFSLQTIKTLRALTEDANDKVRYASAELLWQLQDESAPAVIRNMLENETEASVKKDLIDMLSKDKSKLSLALLSEALKDYDKETRLRAVEAIGGFSNKESILVLNSALQDYDEEVRLKALEAVNRVRRDIELHKEQQMSEIKAKPLFSVE